jgi:hemoglobin-like flavoprotein
MSTPKLDVSPSVRNHIETLVALAGLLERVEKTRIERVGADQYRALVRQVEAALAEEMPDAALQAVLNAYPATGEVYENLHYTQAGLSRSALDRSVASEMATSQLLAKLSARSR